MQDQDSARFIPIKRLGKAIFLKMVGLRSFAAKLFSPNSEAAAHVVINVTVKQ